MRATTRPVLAAVAAIATVAVVLTACGSEDAAPAATVAATDPTATEPTSTDPTATEPTSTDPTATEPASTEPAPTEPAPAATPVMPAGPDDILGTADVRSVLAGLGFRSDFPLPDDLTIDDVAGIALSQSAGDDYSRITREVAWTEPAPDDPEALAQAWFDRAGEVFGVPPSIGSGRLDNGTVEGFLVSSGDAEDESGELTVTVIRPVDDATSPVVVEVSHQIEVQGFVPDLTYAPALAAQLPDVSGCVAEIAQARFRRYDVPNDAPEEPAYVTIFDGNCPDESALDAVREWTSTSNGQVNDGEGKVNVYGATGPDGIEIEASAFLTDEGVVVLRVDTTTPIG